MQPANTTKYSLKNHPNQRIATLDGFRFLCILAVMLYHYFAAYTVQVTATDFYPYHDKFVHFYLFRYGYLGVQCFFIISGFVIFMTLEKTSTIKEFVIRRFIRLWPTLLICSLVSFATLHIFPYKWLSPNFAAFLPSLTITQPYLWGRFFNIGTYFIDGVEWTLVVEISFYAISSILYFTNKASFFFNWIIFVISLLSAHFLAEKLGLTKVGTWLDLYLFPIQMVYFTAGIYLYMLYENRRLRLFHHLTVISLVSVQLIYLQSFLEDIFLLAFIGLFLLFVYKPSSISFLSHSIIAKIGVWSYTTYLIHNWIGVVLINEFAKLFKTQSAALTIVPAVVVIILLVFAIENLAIALRDKIFKPLLARF
jgi:peptidoglycan/LPS O-acetylase OafA/YrhL